ncbi:MAG: pilus assembly protein [Archangiaceae bacterium]|nr:pilus assembly protein [Archangiaceae bacterium]
MRGDAGQAAVETALTLPLTLFLVLGTTQVFMLLQGRLMAEHAVYKAVRVGVVNHGDCTAMTHAAVASLLPSFNTFLGTVGQKLGASDAATAFAAGVRARTVGVPDANRFHPVYDAPHDRAIVWLYRESPLKADVGPESEDDFDDPDRSPSGSFGYRLEVRMVYWYPLRIPFANWVLSAMFRAYFGLQSYTYVNPLLAAQDARGWVKQSTNTFAKPVADEYTARHELKQYTFPITVGYGMRMMTPPRPQLFARQNCPGAQ